MKKLKEKFGKYFQFKNTINGTNYFLRGLAIFLFFIPSVIIFFWECGQLKMNILY